MRYKGYDFIRFIATLLIFTFHFFAHTENLKIEKTAWLVSAITARGNLTFGNIGVALFFMLSGALLWANYQYEFDTLIFYKKRLLKICIPQYIGFIGAIIVSYITYSGYISNLIHGGIKSWIGFFLSFLGLTLAGNVYDVLGIPTVWIIGEWFTSVIIIIYFLFPLFRWGFKKHRVISTIIIIIIYILNSKFLFLSRNEGWHSYTYGFMCFWVGMLFEEYKIKLKSCFMILDIIIIAIYYVRNPSNILVNNTFVCLLFSFFLFVLLFQVNVETKFTKYINKYSYEIYLVHHRVYILIMSYWLSNFSSEFQIYLCFFVLTGLTFLIAEALNKVSKFFIDIIMSKEKSFKSKLFLKI